jgi:[lysine-biosynthesis-protein LysW]--L-2-aminoadipate ligase
MEADMTRIGFLNSRLRVEEKLLLAELESRPDVEVVRINDGKHYFDISSLSVDVVLERSISYSRGLYVSQIWYSGCECIDRGRTVWR